MPALKKLCSAFLIFLLPSSSCFLHAQNQAAEQMSAYDRKGTYNVYFEEGKAAAYSTHKTVISYFKALDRLTVRPDAEFTLDFWKNLPGVKAVYTAERSFEFLGVAEVNHARANYLHGPAYNLKGDSIKIGQFDASTVRDHIDFGSRAIKLGPIYGGSNQNHATQVFGLMAGAGTGNPRALGVAPRSTVYSWDIYRDIPIAMDSLGKLGVYVMQHAYAYNSAGDSCHYRGRYDDFSNEVDFLIKFFPKMVQVAGCGNFQSQCGLGGFRTISSGLQASKNIITVGSITASDQMSSNSSFGPVRDGRLKPEIVAQGSAVFTTNPPHSYISNINGTSYSSPVVTGTVALMQQHYKRKFGVFPNADLVKAIVINSADDLGNPGPDFKFGYGKLNAVKAIEHIDSAYSYADALQQGDYYIDSIHTPAGAKRLKVTLVYNDFPGTPYAPKTLVNDLDLTVSKDTQVTFPFVLDTAAGNFNNTAQRGRDSINNTEQVIIDNPSGSYALKIFGRKINALQSFVFVYRFEYPELKLTYPAGGEHLDPGVSTPVRWNSSHITDSLKAYYSVDSGQSWIAIDTLIPPGRQFVNWTIPDSVTSKGFVKILSGSYSSTHIAPFHIFRMMSDTMSFDDCSSLSRIKWRTQKNTLRYHLYKLDGDHMQKIATTSDTTAIVTGLSNLNTYWFAIQLEAANGALSQRSTAQRHYIDATVFSAKIEVPPGDIHVCSGDTATFTAQLSGTAPLDIRWQFRDSSMVWDTIPAAIDTFIKVHGVGAKIHREYRILVNNVCNSIDSSLTVRLYVDTVPEFILHPANKTVCSGQSVSFKALSNNANDLIFWQIQYPDSAWKDIQMDSLLEFSSVPYSYNGSKVRITASNVCGIDTSDEALLTVRAPLSINLLQDSFEACKNKALLIQGNGSGGDSSNYKWLINGDSMAQMPYTYHPSQDTSFSIELYDNCSSFPAFADVYMSVDTTKGGFSFHIDYPVKNDPKQIRFLPFDSSTSYKWFFGDGDSSALKSPSHLYPALSSYLVTQRFLSAKGCLIEFSKMIQLLDNVSVHEIGEKHMVIYPNPSSDGSFEISVPGIDLSYAELIVTDVSGRELKNVGIIEAKNEICRVRFHGAAQGVYQIRLITRGSVFTGKLLIMD